MLKYCLKKWDLYKQDLENALKNDYKLNSCDYKYLLEKLIICVLNGGEREWNEKEIIEIDNGHYQGTLLFIFHRNTYQPSEYDYLMAYVGYGSCSGCDTLQAIQRWNDEPPTEGQLKDYMTLCKDILCNIVKPYNNGWRNEDEFEVVESEE